MKNILNFKKRKYLSILLFVLILINTVLTGYGYAEKVDKSQVFFGEELSEIVAIEKYNEIYLPFRAVLEKLGYKVDWDMKTWSAIAEKNDSTYIVKIGAGQIIETSSNKEGNPININKPVELLKSRTIVTVDTISKITGLDIVVEDKNILIPIKEIKKPRLEDDYYDYVNYEWFRNTELPYGKGSEGGFEDLDAKIGETLNKDINDKLKKDISSEKVEMKNFINYYKGALNFEKRNNDGIKPLLSDLEKIENIKSLDDISKNIKELYLSDIKLPIKIGITIDIKNTDKYLLAPEMPDLIIGHSSRYEPGNKVGQEHKEKLIKTYTDIMVMLGKNKEEAESISKKGMEFDELISKYIKEPISSYDEIINEYNIVKKRYISSISKNINFKKIVKSLTGKLPKKIVLLNKEYYDDMDKILNEENLDMIKSWMYLNTLSNGEGKLSDEYDKYFNKYNFLGREEMVYSESIELFAPVVGNYYGETYFGEEAKKDVENMAEEILKVYRSRIKELDWLTKETKKRAIKKIDSLSIKIGYEENIPVSFSKFTYDNDKSFYENNKKIKRILNEEVINKYFRPVDREIWGMNVHKVDAMFFPLINTIVIPAGILQEPFYDIERTHSENYGGIGSIIAHEISHALDPTGSKFDEKGNFVNWWTDKDRVEYDKKIKEMEELFDGLEFANGKVDGKKTVSENIADAGGLSIAYEAVKTKKNFSPEKFFESWATIWRQLSTEEFKAEILKEDVHSPNKIRSNMQLSNLDEFNEFYKLKEKDKMYMAPEKRVRIW